MEQLPSGVLPFSVAEGNRALEGPHLKCLCPKATSSVLFTTHWPERVTWLYSTTRGPRSIQFYKVSASRDSRKYLVNCTDDYHTGLIRFIVFAFLTSHLKSVCHWSVGRSGKNFYIIYYKYITTNEKRIQKYLKMI